MYNELIDALRNCADSASCDKCPYEMRPRCTIDMMRDSADAIERLMAEVEELKRRKQWTNTKD